MYRFIRPAALALALVAGAAACQEASAVAPYMWPQHRARSYNWNGNYAHSAYGQPVALVVPSVSNIQTNWGWGVGSSRVSRIDHQFGRNYPGYGAGYAGPYRTLPRWPHDTQNFGVYYVRGPW